MCGFVGIYSPKNPELADLQLLKRMTDTLTHRGPDAQYLSRQPGLGLGFCRLSIIDLLGGKQPIFNEDGTVVLVCNGEIYNYRALRKKLRQRGHCFQAEVDVEVLVHLYEENGPEFVQELSGQFAFALYDQPRQRLLLGRDPAGIAPLYYFWRDGTLLFASEIKALLEHPLVDRRVDLTGLDQVLTFPGPVSPRTLFADIRSVPPGHMLIVEAGVPVCRAYWDLDYPLQSDLDPNAAPDIDSLEASLRAAVVDRLHADVDVGFYLSGGLDSSLIAALVREIDDKEGRTQERHAFSIGFADGRIDEQEQQKLVARQIGARHHTEIFESEAIQSRLYKAVWHSETPLKESYNTCSLALSSLARRNALKVVLTGEGADELFGGYVGYRLNQHRRVRGDAFGLESQLEREQCEKLWGDPDFFYEKDYSAVSELKGALYAPSLVADLKNFDCCNQPLVEHGKLRGRHPLHQRSYVDFKLRLADHLLADHGDRMAYANSVEARYPFLDPGVIEWARTAPPHWLIRDKIEKYPLRQVSARYLPREITERQKFGFVAPSSATLLQGRVEWVEDLLSHDRIAGAGYFNADTVERLKESYREPGFNLNTTFDTDLLMIVLSFEVFRDCFSVPRL